MMTDYTKLPEYMRGGMQRYIQDGVAPGDFLQAVLKNDLMHAVGQADDANVKLLPLYVRWLYNEVPGAAWGSEENFKNWIKHHPSNAKEKL
jgi:hypothetical protein